MLLGLVLHAGVSYMRDCPTWWAVCDPSKSAAFDLLNSMIHSFRMQAFFLMSGFFALLLIERIGLRAFAEHRFRRIVIPFAVSLLVIVPLTRASWIFAWWLSERPGVPFWTVLIEHYRETGWGAFETIWHLWFLEYILIYYLLMAPSVVLVKRTPRWLGDWVDRATRWSMTSVLGPVALAIPTALLMLPMSSWSVDGVSSIVPRLHMVAYYGFFFLSGILVFRCRDRLSGVGENWLLNLVLAVGVATPILSMLHERIETVDARWAPWVDVAGQATSGLFTWLMVFAVTGLFLRFMDTANRIVRYLCDASYWVYLVHLPLVILANALLLPLKIHAIFKFLGTIAAVFVILIATYQVLVRYTVIGRTLHGRRSVLPESG